MEISRDIARAVMQQRIGKHGMGNAGGMKGIWRRISWLSLVFLITVKKYYMNFKFSVAAAVMIGILIPIGSCRISKGEGPQREMDQRTDVLEMIYAIADKKGMRVISDLNMSGGRWHERISADSMEEQTKRYISAYHARYGQHPSFRGWYLNNEISPIKTTETEKSGFWRKVWKAVVDECHKVRPEHCYHLSVLSVR